MSNFSSNATCIWVCAAAPAENPHKDKLKYNCVLFQSELLLGNHCYFFFSQHQQPIFQITVFVTKRTLPWKSTCCEGFTVHIAWKKALTLNHSFCKRSHMTSTQQNQKIIDWWPNGSMLELVCCILCIVRKLAKRNEHNAKKWVKSVA